MKEEIKEMIDKIKKCLISGYDLDIITQEEMGILWNCITNLQEENERLNENKRHTLNAINRTIEIIKQQPTEDDSWILDRLDGFKYVLKGDKDE